MKMEEIQKTGIQLIADERHENQIKKHGFTGEHHAQHPEWYDKGQLPYAAELLISMNPVADDQYPLNWDYTWFKDLLCRSYKERLVIAGALIASELDRLMSLGK